MLAKKRASSLRWSLSHRDCWITLIKRLSMITSHSQRSIYFCKPKRSKKNLMGYMGKWIRPVLGKNLTIRLSLVLKARKEKIKCFARWLSLCLKSQNRKTWNMCFKNMTCQHCHLQVVWIKMNCHRKNLKQTLPPHLSRLKMKTKVTSFRLHLKPIHSMTTSKRSIPPGHQSRKGIHCSWTNLLKQKTRNCLEKYLLW